MSTVCRPSSPVAVGQQDSLPTQTIPSREMAAGYDNQERQGGGDRFPLHRRRRRHRGPRNDVQGMPEMGGHDGGDEAAPGE